jgi:hypothetical protein
VTIAIFVMNLDGQSELTLFEVRILLRMALPDLNLVLLQECRL